MMIKPRKGIFLNQDLPEMNKSSHWWHCQPAIKVNTGPNGSRYQTSVSMMFILLRSKSQHRCSIIIHTSEGTFVLHLYKFWPTYLSERRSYASLESEDIKFGLVLRLYSTTFLNTIVNFESIHFKGYCIYYPIILNDENTYRLLQNGHRVFRYSA